MNATRTSVYARPVHELEKLDEEAGDGETPVLNKLDMDDYEVNRPETDEEERIIVTERDAQTGMNTIIARIDDPERPNTEDERFRFRITDTEKQRCSYKGEDIEAIPIDVLHAVYHFGYSITENRTHGDWFSYRTETQSLLGNLNIIFSTDSYDNPVISSIARRTAGITNLLDLALVLKYVSHVESKDYSSQFWDNHTKNGDERVESIGFHETNDALMGEIEKHGYSELLGGDDDGEPTKVVFGFDKQRIESSEGDYIAIGIISSYGIERFLFYLTGDDTCNYVPQPTTSIPNPHTVEYMEEDGYAVTNAGQSFTGPMIERIEHGLDLLEDLQSFDFGGSNRVGTERHPMADIAELAQKHLKMLHTMLDVYVEDERLYNEVTDRVLSETGITEDMVERMNLGNFTKLVRVIAESHPETVVPSHEEKKLRI